MPNGDKYYPDFVLGVQERVLLVEIKGEHIVNYEDSIEKLNAEHSLYGKPLMLTKQGNNQFWIMRYIESSRKAEPDQVFRIENLGS